MKNLILIGMLFCAYTFIKSETQSVENNSFQHSEQNQEISIIQAEEPSETETQSTPEDAEKYIMAHLTILKKAMDKYAHFLQLHSSKHISDNEKRAIQNKLDKQEKKLAHLIQQSQCIGNMYCKANKNPCQKCYWLSYGAGAATGMIQAKQLIYYSQNM